MSTLLEKIAAKKALAAAQTEAPTPASIEESKPMSFAEKMALKKAAHDVPTVVPTSTIVPVGSINATVQNESAPANGSVPILPAASIVVGEVEAPTSEEETVNLDEVPAEVQQAYVDIKAKIDKLADMSEMNLKDAMTDLKKSLLQNPQACYLILPYDIGQMVVALRAIRGEALVEASSDKPKGPKKSKASKPLTAEEIAQAFDEL